MAELPAGFLDRPVAHRGLHGDGRDENARAAIAAACAAGWGIEIDIQPSADGVPMVFHDATLDRLTARSGRIDAVSAVELAGVTLPSGETIPTLAEVLEIVAGRVPLVVEIKDQDGALGPDVGPLEAAVCGALADYAGPVAVMSFNPHSVKHCRKVAPHIPRGLTTCGYGGSAWAGLPTERRRALAAMEGLDALGAAFISHAHRELDAAPVATAKAAGLAVLCWTIRSAAEEAAARRIADQITFEGYSPG